MTVAREPSASSVSLYAARFYWFARRRTVAFDAKRQARDIHVIQAKNTSIAYIPIPKNACTSIKTAFFDVQNSDRKMPFHNWQRNRVHRYFHGRVDAWMSLDELRQLDCFRFLVLRHPFDRFMSAYRNRVVKFRDIEKDPLSRIQAQIKGLDLRPSLETFAARLSEYAAINGSISHHVRPQARFVRDRNAVNATYLITELDRLADELHSQHGLTISIGQSKQIGN